MTECCWGVITNSREAPAVAGGARRFTNCRTGLRRALGAQRVSQQGHVLRVVPRAVVAEAGADGVRIPTGKVSLCHCVTTGSARNLVGSMFHVLGRFLKHNLVRLPILFLLHPTHFFRKKDGPVIGCLVGGCVDGSVGEGQPPTHPTTHQPAFQPPAT